MKKRTKKLLAIGMAAIMTAGLAVGCGKKATPENLLTDMGKNLAGIESAVMKLEVGAEMTDGTDTIGFEMGLDMESVLKTKDSHAKGKVNLEMMGTSIGTEIEMYNVKEDDKYVTYMLAADEWSKEEIDAEDIDSASTTEDFEKMAEDIAKHADAFTLSEEKTEVDGKKCFELKGEIDGGEVSNLMEDDMMGELSSAGMDSDMLADMKIPCTIAIYEKEILPAKISLDMKSAMKDLAEESGVEISEFYLDLIYVDFDSVDEIKVPEEVKTEAKGIGSPEKDVLTAYGEPNDRYENDEGGKSFTWFEEDHYMNGCMIDIEEGTGVVDYMSLTCYK